MEAGVEFCRDDPKSSSNFWVGLQKYQYLEKRILDCIETSLKKYSRLHINVIHSVPRRIDQIGSHYN